MKRIHAILMLVGLIMVGCTFFILHKDIMEKKNYYSNFKSASIYNTKDQTLQDGYAVLEGEIESEDKFELSGYIKPNNNLLVEDEYEEEFNGKGKWSSGLIAAWWRESYSGVKRIKILGKSFLLAKFDISPNIGISDLELKDEFKPLYKDGYIWLNQSLDKPKKGNMRVKIVSIPNHSKVAAFVKIKNGELENVYCTPVICFGNSENEAYLKLEQYLRSKVDNH